MTARTQIRPQCRTVMVLDAGLQFLKKYLEEVNFRVIDLDDYPLADIVTHRVLVTQEVEKFRYKAPVVEFSIIGLPANISPSFENGRLFSHIISRSVTDFSLCTKCGSWLLAVTKDGEISHSQIC